METYKHKYVISKTMKWIWNFSDVLGKRQEEMQSDSKFLQNNLESKMC
jgi:hypothetical protein